MIYDLIIEALPVIDKMALTYSAALGANSPVTRQVVERYIKLDETVRSSMLLTKKRELHEAQGASWNYGANRSKQRKGGAPKLFSTKNTSDAKLAVPTPQMIRSGTTLTPTGDSLSVPQMNSLSAAARNLFAMRKEEHPQSDDLADMLQFREQNEMEDGMVEEGGSPVPMGWAEQGDEDDQSLSTAERLLGTDQVGDGQMRSPALTHKSEKQTELERRKSERKKQVEKQIKKLILESPYAMKARRRANSAGPSRNPSPTGSPTRSRPPPAQQERARSVSPTKLQPKKKPF